MDLGETVRAIDNMRLVVHEGGRAHAQVVSREGEGRSSVSSRGSTSAAAVGREYQVGFWFVVQVGQKDAS